MVSQLDPYPSPKRQRGTTAIKVQGDEIRSWSDRNLVTGPAVGGLKLVLLRVALGRVLAFRSRAVEIGARTIVKSSLQVHPDLHIRVAHVLWSGRGLGQPETHQRPFEERQF